MDYETVAIFAVLASAILLFAYWDFRTPTGPPTPPAIQPLSYVPPLTPLGPAINYHFKPACLSGLQPPMFHENLGTLNCNDPVTYTTDGWKFDAHVTQFTNGCAINGWAAYPISDPTCIVTTKSPSFHDRFRFTMGT